MRRERRRRRWRRRWRGTRSLRDDGRFGFGFGRLLGLLLLVLPELLIAAKHYIYIPLMNINKITKQDFPMNILGDGDVDSSERTAVQ